MCFEKVTAFLLLVILVPNDSIAGDDDYNILEKDGSYEFGYNNPDSYHFAQANRNNVVKGEFGGKNPKTGGIDNTVYTAGPRGFRPRGKNIVRKYDLNQAERRPVGSSDDPYYDPYEDPSYSFSFRTRTYNRDENANRVGDVNGKYSYIDDVGERHNVEYIAGKNTGFHVKTPFPDSNPRAYGPLYFRGRGRPIPRGRTSIQRGLDGSYKFVSAGPDQRRTETSDATGHVRGSYTYLDDKGVQHSVHYIAGPETGYRVLKTVKGPHLPTVFPFNQPDDFYGYNDKDVFDTAASGRVRPSGRPASKPNKTPGGELSTVNDDEKIEDETLDKKPKTGFGRPDNENDFDVGSKTPAVGKPSEFPYDEDDSGNVTDFGDLFGDNGNGNKDKGTGTTNRKPNQSIGGSSTDNFSGSKEEGSYKPDNNEYIPPKGGKAGDVSEGEYENDANTLIKPSTGGNIKPTSTKLFIGNSGPSENSQSTISKDDDDFGLFGSEGSRPHVPFDGENESVNPVITLGTANKNCKKCEGTILTNIGDTYLSVPPGVSVRAHVHAVDLLPYSSRFPRPSEQYKTDLTFEREQLNSENDKIINEIVDNSGTENDSFTPEATTTEIDITTLLPNSSTT